MPNNGEKAKIPAYEIGVRIASSRDGAEDLRYVQIINARLKLTLRRSGRYPDARFDSTRRKDGILVVGGVPEDALKEELDRCRTQASKDHGYAFSYELDACEMDVEKTEKNELADYDALLAEKDGDNELLKRQLKDAQGERLELEGRLKLAKLDRDSRKDDQIPAEKTTERVEVYPLKATMRLMEGYAGDLNRIDHLFEEFECEISPEKMLELADMGPQDFARTVYGDRFAGLIASAKKEGVFLVPCRMGDVEKLEKLEFLHMVAASYKSFVNSSQKSEAGLPCAMVPRNETKLSLFIPRGKSSKGPVSRLLFHTVRDAVEEAVPAPVETAKHDFVREIMADAGASDRREFARSLANELEFKANEILPQKIGYGLYVANLLDE